MQFTCCIEDCPAWMAAKAAVNPEGFAAGDNESKGFVPMMGGHLETFVSPTPLLNKAFRPKLLLFSLFGKNGKLEIALFEVVGGMIGAFDLCEYDFSETADPMVEDFRLLSIKPRGDIGFGGDEGGE